MADEKLQQTVIVESNLHPYSAIQLGAVLANVRNNIAFLIEKTGRGKWKVKLVQGTREDLLKAIEKAKGVTALD